MAVSIAAGQRHEPTNDNDKDIIVTMIDIAATTWNTRPIMWVKEERREWTQRTLTHRHHRCHSISFSISRTPERWLAQIETRRLDLRRGGEGKLITPLHFSSIFVSVVILKTIRQNYFLSTHSVVVVDHQHSNGQYRRSNDRHVGVQFKLIDTIWERLVWQHQRGTEHLKNGLPLSFASLPSVSNLRAGNRCLVSY